MPYVSFITAYIPRLLRRFFDGRMTIFTAEPTTKKVTILQFVRLYSGPEVILHFRYSMLIMSVYITFTYGLILPILWPITLIHVFNLYVVERLQFAYFYIRPPMIGNTLNEIGLTKL